MILVAYPSGSPDVSCRVSFEERPTVVAPWLLNKVLVRTLPDGTTLSGRIVEVEAYGGSDDPASHAYRGPTKRNRTMFGPGGCLYVYFTYGMHHCANVVCCPEGVAGAVLLRAVAPIRGLEEMFTRRPGARRPTDLASGPGRLCQAMGVDRDLDGADLLTAGSGLALEDDGTPPPGMPGNSPRVGVGAAHQIAWRWWVPGDRNVSKKGLTRSAGGA